MARKDNFVGKWVFPRSTNICEMVGRRRYEDLSRVADYIVEVLHIHPDDTVLDLCCGNGAITQHIATQCKQVIGIDFSESLLATARSDFSADNISYVQGNVFDMTRVCNMQFSKCYMALALQHFAIEDISSLLENVRQVLTEKGQILFTDIPDRSKKRTLYKRRLIELFLPTRSNLTFPTFNDKVTFVREQLLFMINRIRDKSKVDNYTGFWFDVEHLVALARNLNFQAMVLEIPHIFPTSGSRFNLLLQKC